MNTIANDRLLPYGNPAQILFGMIILVWNILIMGNVGICEVFILNATDFENGEMAPWEIFVTPNGTGGEAGLPTVVPFEGSREGNGLKALKFKVGQVRYEPDKEPEQGGGLVTQITTETGMLYLSTDVAVTYHSPKDKRNLAGGLFEWIVDDHVIASYDMGPIDNGGVLRHHLKVQHGIKAGVHTIRLRITRPFASHPGQHAPFQYVDDLLLQFSLQP